MFYFHEFLERLNLTTEHVRLVRHDSRGLVAWRRGKFESFGCFASFQTLAHSPYSKTDLACQFVPGPRLSDGDATALFIGITRITDRWHWDGKRLPVLQDQEIIGSERGNVEVEAFDLQWLDAGTDYSERILVRWGGTRAWSQWASNKPKEIVEIRRGRSEPPFPGFSRFMARISEVLQLPETWQAALRSCGGVYLLVADNGEQYVGSAAGQDGFLGRWTNYAANGHGGNVLLRQRGYKDYSVSILEIASTDMGIGDILAREQHWKTKLGARVHGLNLN